MTSPLRWAQNRFSLQGQYRFEGTGFSTIPQLIEHHFSTKQVITKKSGVVLLNPVVKVTATCTWQASVGRDESESEEKLLCVFPTG